MIAITKSPTKDKIDKNIIALICERFEPRSHFKSRLTLKMTTVQVVETSITVNNNSPIPD